MPDDDSEISILGGTRHIKFGSVLRHTHRTDGACVVLSGTLVEGIGNRFSDIDVYVLCADLPDFAAVREERHAFVHKPDMNFCRADTDKVFMTMDYYEDAEFHLDIEYWDKNSVHKIVGKVNSCFVNLLTHCDNNYSEYEIRRVEHLLLHRCLVGKVICGPDVSLFGIGPEFARRYGYTLYRSTANYYWRFKDIAGALDAQDGYLACELGREFLSREMQAFTHLRGCTNPTRKWFMTYWKQHCLPLDAELYRAALGLLSQMNPKDCDSYLRSVFSVVDRIEEHNRRATEKMPGVLAPSNSLSLLEQEAESRSKTSGVAQEHEFLFRRRTYSGDGMPYMEILRQL